LTIYLITLVVQVLRPVYFLVHGHSLLLDLPVGDEFYDFVSPPAVILAGRFVVLASSLGIVALGMVLARRLAGTRAALAAGILLALCPALAQRGSIVIVDTVATLCVLATLLAAERLRTVASRGEGSASTSAAFLAGLLAGAAAAAKYPAGVVFVVVCLSLVGPRREWKLRRRLLLIATAGLCAGAVIGTPAFLLRPREIARALLEQSRLYANPGLFSSTGGPGLLREALLPEELGTAACLLGLAGIMVLLRNKVSRPLALAWTAFAAVLVLPLVVHAYQPFRYVLVLVPPLLIAAGAFLFAESPAPTPARVAVGALGLFAVLISFVPGLKWTYRERGVQDSRAIFVDWLATKVQPKQRILVVRELAFLPAELSRISATVVVAPCTDVSTLTEGRTFDALVYGRFDASAPAPGWEDRAADLARCEAWTRRLEPVAHFGSDPTPIYPNFWRSNRELILLAARSPAGEPMRNEIPAP
jgi:hypothetical protein